MYTRRQNWKPRGGERTVTNAPVTKDVATFCDDRLLDGAQTYDTFHPSWNVPLFVRSWQIPSTTRSRLLQR